MAESMSELRAQRIASLPFLDVSSRRGGLRGGNGSVQEIWRHRELLLLLVGREIKARYKDSSLGVVWSLFRPLVQLAIYYLAIGQILGAARATPDFAVFVFIGLTLWGLFTEIVQSATTSIIGNAGLVKKVYLPREIFPLSSVGGALFNFGIQSVVLLLGIVVLASFPIGWSLLLAPAAVITVVVFATAIGLALSAINVYLRDVQHFVEIAILVLFWASPIVYSFTFVHNALAGSWVESLYLANPITICIIAMQRALWNGGITGTGDFAQVWPDDIGLRLLIAFVVSVVLLFIAQRIFTRLQGNFAQEL